MINPEMISLLVFLLYNFAFLDAKIIRNDKTRPDEKHLETRRTFTTFLTIMSKRLQVGKAWT